MALNEAIVKAGISGVFSYFGIPADAALSLYSEILKDRAREGVEILLSEVRQGNFTNVDRNELVSVCAKFERDAMEGVAKKNLRILAALIRGLAENDRLQAPTFRKYSGILSSLTDDEMSVLAIMVKYRQNGEFVQRDLALKKRFTNPEAILQALMRTGLVTLKVHDIRDIGEGLQKYSLTHVMDEVLNYIDASHFSSKAM